MSESVEGGCLCGAVRYRVPRDKLGQAFHCHCTDCQRCTGSGKATIVLSPTADLQINGELNSFTVTGSAGSHITRCFCPRCGSPLISYVEEAPQQRFIKAGSFDDPSWVTVDATFWGDSAHPWSPVDPSCHAFARNPDQAL